MPLTQHTLPILNCKSYSEWPQWEYRRVKGLGNVQLNDIVVFNYPSGDTVALNAQNADYYTLAYGYGAQLNPHKPVMDSRTTLQQRAIYAQNYAYGTRYPTIR